MADSKIQWFPGHMAKAMRSIEEMKALSDGVIVVLDARSPVGTLNKNLKKALGGKPTLYLLNKSDMADPVRTDGFIKLIAEKGSKAVKACGINQASRHVIISELDKMVKEKRERSLAKGVNKSFRFMVVGIPNTGKSTVINLLSGVKKAETGDKAGVTKQTKWIKCSSFDLLDTPGTMPPSIDDQVLARHLAYIGSINDAILHMDDIALSLLAELAEKYPSALKERYGITDFSSPLDMLTSVCRKRGFILKGGVDVDYEKGIRALIDDFRKCRLGKITLEEPAEYSGAEF